VKAVEMNDDNARQDGVLRQSGVIPFKLTERGIEVLLITTTGAASADGRKWSVPKGGVDPGMTPQESAANEAFEEAGAIGRVLEPAVGSYEYEKSGRPAVVEVFLFEVREILDEWLESGTRKRRWCAWEDALSSVSFKEVRDLIDRLPEFLRSFGYDAGVG
jgi:8-oxo-dGTP pyrophosphatase MutT (NUDIX family)